MSGNRPKSAFFEGVGHFECRFQREGGIADNHSWYQSNRVIALSCGIKISAVRHLVLSQCTRVTDRRTDGQNYDSQNRPRICSRGKNSSIVVTENHVSQLLFVSMSLACRLTANTLT